MKKTIRILSIVLTIMLLGCGDRSSVNSPIKDVQISPTEQNILNANNVFGFRLLKTLTKSPVDNNVLISPVSVSMALGMTLNGADGATYDSMQAALGFQNFTPEEVNQSYRHLIELLQSLDSKVVMEIANSIWIRKGFPVESAFKEINQHSFNARITNLDFTLPSAADEINNWVSDKTHERITKIINGISPAEVMFLINALYFKGIWTYKFDKSKTQEAQFHISANNSMTVDMMTQTNDFQYFTNDIMQVVDLPYGDGDFSMTILLPGNNQTIDNIIQNLDSQRWNTLISSLSKQEGTLYLPRFEIRYKDFLNSALSSMGMQNAFDSQLANFSRINKDGGLSISQVQHTTFMHVDESGTEAAAVTSIGMQVTSIGGGKFVMRIDHPFLLAIRERTSGANLFLGVIEQPERIDH